jgi:protocatechuate 3,4-dioxygenase beta subunit
LLDLDRRTQVQVSIDPFFFTVTDVAGGVIAGTVTDINSTPILDATVLIKTDAGFLLQLSTDAGGHYISTVLPPGLYDVSAVHDGFVPADATVDVLDPTLLTKQDFVLEVTRTFTLSGLVTDTASVPVVRATVSLTQDSPSLGTFTAQSDSMGHYIFNNIDPGPFDGQYTGVASAAGYASDTQTFLIPNGATLVRNFMLKKRGVLTGRVADTAGAPLGGASVSLGGSPTFTDTTGFYSIALDPGQYTATASLTGFRAVTASILIPIGGSVVHDFTLERAATGTITGVVTDDGGSPILNASVGGIGTPTARTDSDGQYTLANVLPGTYRITASSGHRLIPDTETATVREGQTTVVNFVLVFPSRN